MDVLSFKQKVFEFALNSPEVLDKREIMAINMNEDWDSYWKRMLKDREWADTNFVHCTAWYLNMDLFIVSDACNERNKHFIVHGYFDEDDLVRKKLYLGYITDTHYQSILPKKVDQGIGEYSATKIYFFPRQQKNCEKFPNILSNFLG